MARDRKTKQEPRAAPPPVRAKGAPRRRRASPRVLAAGAGVAAVIVAAVAIAAVLTGGKNSTVGTLPTSGSLSNALPGASEVNALFKRIPQKGLTLGSSSAPVTLVEYIDLQCPFCQQFETQVLPDIVTRYVRTGKVKIEARVLDFIGPDSSRGRNAMIAAGQQGNAFNFAELLYDNQGTENTGWLSDGMVARAAESIPGLNPQKVFSARDSAAVKQQAAAFDQEANAAGVTGTPTLFVGKSGTSGKQVPLASPTDERALVQAIEAALA
jgi:protein-disulfide isomerase